MTTHSRSNDGRYIVRLPFKFGPPIDIGDSRALAERRLKSLMRKLRLNPDQQGAYTEFLEEYERLGHMKQVTFPLSSSRQRVYIPHHPVIRDTSTTTRMRVVFDASSVTSNGTSLNQHLLTGPKLQQDLADISTRWRQYRYVYTADIAKMYRQILIDPRDADY